MRWENYLQKKLVKIIIVILCIGILCSIWIYYSNKKKETAVLEHSIDYIVSKYNEDNNFSNLSIEYDFGRGNYFILLQNDTTNKFYSLEVKLAKNLSLVYIYDNTLYDPFPD